MSKKKTDPLLWALLVGGVVAVGYGLRKKKPVTTTGELPVEPTPAGPEGFPWDEPDPEPFNRPDAVGFISQAGDVCLQGWSDQDLRTLMVDRLVEVPWTGQTTNARVFEVTRSTVDELCPQLLQPQTYEEARDATDPVFRAAWDRLTPIAWDVVFKG